MKLFSIIAIVLVIAVFTGTWIFGLSGDIFYFISKAFRFLEKIFNFFGWNNGMLSVGGVFYV